MPKPQLILLLLLLTQSLMAQVPLPLKHRVENNAPFLPTPYYVLADEVIMRAEPNKQANIITSLPIGTKLELLQESDSTLTLKEIQSPWYEVKTKQYQGWMWGGFITNVAFGSSQDGEVKFVVGFDRKEKTEARSWGQNFIQVRAIRKGVQVDKLVFPMLSSSEYVYAKNRGKCGLKNVDDVIEVDIPCVGGCGCIAGSHYVFWDGEKLKDVADVTGMADAEYSEGSYLIFPSDMDGEAGYIKMFTDAVGFEHEPDSIMERIHTITYHQWTGQKLVESRSRKPIRRVLLYNTRLGNWVKE